MVFPAVEELWSAGAPLIHKLHMWFVLRGRLWTADRLARRGLEHPVVCALCYQEQETVEHLTVQCSFAREVWYSMLLPLRLHRFMPMADSALASWWCSVSAAVPKQLRKDVNSLIILVARCL